MVHRPRYGLPSPGRYRAGLLVVVAATVAACAAGAGPNGSPTGGPDASSNGGSPIAVLGTENFYADLLSQVGGDRVRATSLLNNPNTDPHSFDASPQAAATVADAKLVIVNGFGYDDFMSHLLAASPNPQRLVIDVETLLGLPVGSNAHVWYDPATMPKVATAVEQALATLEPSSSAYFASRLATYQASLQPLSARVAELRAAYAGAPVAFTEPVAGYLAQAIGLRVLTPDGFMKAIENGTDPAPGDVAAERDLLTTHAVRVLLYNSQATTPLTKQIRDLAVASGIPVLGVAETMPPEYPTYVAWQLAAMTALGQALGNGR